MKKFSYMSLMGLAAVVIAAPVAAAPTIASGTIGFVYTSVPTVNLSVDPSTVKFNNFTVDLGGTGAFANASGVGTLNGTIDFSKVAGDSVSDSVTNFFTFGDGTLGNYKFSVDSVTTVASTLVDGYNNFTLELAGNALDVGFLGNIRAASTPVTMTLQFNQTGGSVYTASGTLATGSAVPEPASWAMMVGGFGMLGGALRRKSVPSVVTFG